MGTWSADNFGNDGALDYLGDIINGLEKKIEDIFNSGTAADLDECGESELIPSVAIISILCENCNGAPPTQEKIKQWRGRYLLIFDKQIDLLGPDKNYKKERRQVIEDTFNKLLKQSQEFYK